VQERQQRDDWKLGFACGPSERLSAGRAHAAALAEAVEAVTDAPSDAILDVPTDAPAEDSSDPEV